MSAAFCLYSNSYYLFDYHFFCIVMRRHSQLFDCEHHQLVLFAPKRFIFVCSACKNMVFVSIVQ